MTMLLSDFIKNLSITQNEVVQRYKDAISRNRKTVITYFDQRCFNYAYKNKAYLQLLMKEDFFVFLDGVGMRWARALLYNSKSRIYNGTDIYHEIIADMVKNNISTFIIGGKKEDNILTNILISGLSPKRYLNGYEDVEDINLVLSKVNESMPNVVIIGMGVPRQEFLANQIINNSEDVKLILCVGNFFQFFSGNITRAPKFLINSGFEWLFRLIVEPKKTWKRYLLGIPLFIWRIIILKFKMKNSML